MQATHSHHWVIDEAQGPTSRGRCKLCGKQADFANSTPDGGFSDTAKMGRARDAREDGGDFWPGGDRLFGPAAG